MKKQKIFKFITDLSLLLSVIALFSSPIMLIYTLSGVFAGSSNAHDLFLMEILCIILALGNFIRMFQSNKDK